MELYIEKIYRPPGKFIPGHTTWNKGFKGLSIGGEETQFKPGYLPHNTKYDGCISVRKNQNKSGSGYKYIRISVGNWKLYHRYLWEEKYGPIPKGYILVSKNGNTLNCDPENWLMITRKKHVRKNYNRKKASRSLKKTWKSEKIRVRLGIKQLTKLRVK